MKNDPKPVAAARELRARWLERVNAGQDLPQAAGKYLLTGLPRSLIPAQARRLAMIEAKTSQAA